jgi:hypothetical protein
MLIILHISSHSQSVDGRCYTTLLHPEDASSLPADLVNTRYPPEIWGCEDTSGRRVMVKGLISH